ncbi:unnamed protein product [Pleuronectes platessa]|uniref:Uncharacterized protein n=1 Tax=Pleuronectes platessa TaxID=8262 RepID=A0A9N7Y1Q6_PLEPL|nr:unnamed protein product [Pleuronectes platessa]
MCAHTLCPRHHKCPSINLGIGIFAEGGAHMANMVRSLCCGGAIDVFSPPPSSVLTRVCPTPFRHHHSSSLPFTVPFTARRAEAGVVQVEPRGGLSALPQNAPVPQQQTGTQGIGPDDLFSLLNVTQAAAKVTCQRVAVSRR